MTDLDTAGDLADDLDFDAKPGDDFSGLDGDDADAPTDDGPGDTLEDEIDAEVGDPDALDEIDADGGAPDA